MVINIYRTRLSWLLDLISKKGAIVPLKQDKGQASDDAEGLIIVSQYAIEQASVFSYQINVINGAYHTCLSPCRGCYGAGGSQIVFC